MNALRDLNKSGSSDYLGGCPVSGVDFSRHDSDVQWLQGDIAITAMPLPGEAEAGSAGKQPAKEYPGLRCAKGVSAPG